MPTQSAGASLKFEITRTQCRVILPKSTSDRPSVLAFSHHKAGSTMLVGILRELSAAAGVTFLTLPGELFRRGVDLQAVDLDVTLPDRGYCFGGYRFFPAEPMPLIDTARAVLLVRDPRDAVVSLYYSARDSHIIPDAEGTLRSRMLSRRANAKATPIDQWVIENHGAVIEAMTGYVAQGFPSRPNVAIYRYEDIIFRKRAWIDDMLAWFGWEVPETIVAEVVRRFDVVPKKADPSKHIRQVHPGNHRTALQPATIERLNAAFVHLLNLFGYAD
jgi:hypothetical protein